MIFSQFLPFVLAAVLVGVQSTPLDSAHDAASSSQCRCLPGDSCWPSTLDWAIFNYTLGGKLVATVPLAQPCHDPHYNQSACANLTSSWFNPTIHYESSSSVMAPFYANRSCDPFTPETAQCIHGTYVEYAVKVATSGDVAKTIEFANHYNIRLVIRNTGHDYNGKSTGAGGLAIWTHYLKDIEVIDYKSAEYTGKAMKMGAGIQGFEANSIAHMHGLAVVGGECITVGIAGGYTQGGGHSALSSRYGLAADQVLEWEVVDGKGNYLIANSTSNSDLFWALRGGGGGTYGVVLSMTVKAHPDVPVAAANFTFTNQGVSQETFFKAVATYHETLPSLVDAGVMSVEFFSNTTFLILAMSAPGISSAELQQLLNPFFNQLTALGVQHNSDVYQFPSYLDELTSMFGTLGVGFSQYAGRLIPRSVVQNNNAALTSALEEITNKGGIITGVGLNVSQAVAGNVDNAVLPAWRDTLIHLLVTTPWNFFAPWEKMIADQRLLTNDLIPILEKLIPNSGSYLNECDANDPNWKQNFYGANYDKLLSIKNKYDPNHMFYALTAVGSDYWTYNNDGRLCKTAS